MIRPQLVSQALPPQVLMPPQEKNIRVKVLLMQLTSLRKGPMDETVLRVYENNLTLLVIIILQYLNIIQYIQRIFSYYRGSMLLKMKMQE